MPLRNEEAYEQHSPNDQLNSNGKRAASEDHSEQPAKRLASDDRVPARQSSQSLTVVSIEQHDASSASESESEDSAHQGSDHTNDLPQRLCPDYMTQSYPQVNFAPEMLRRTWFHVAVARNPDGHSYQMNLREAMDAKTFSNGVQRRLKLLGYEIGSGVMVADLHWIPTRSCLRENSDHDALMWQVWDWPGWRGDGEMPFLNVYLVLEDKATEVEVKV